MRQALTIAGFDPGGGAGVIADAKTMHAHGVYAACVITAVTVQNTREVRDAVELPPELVRAQCDAIADDFDLAAIKTGMLSSGEMVRGVAAFVRDRCAGVPLVVDPVMASEGGFPLLEEGVPALREALLPLARVVTPNIAEARELSGLDIESIADMRAAAERIAGRESLAVVVKGGHARFAPGVDVLFESGKTTQLDPRADSPLPANVHGTGCTFASAIAARLALGEGVGEAVATAKRYVEGVMAAAARVGRGDPPGRHFYFTKPWAD